LGVSAQNVTQVGGRAEFYVFQFAMDPTNSIKLCANLGKSATETLEMIRQTFGKEKHETYTENPNSPRPRQVKSKVKNKFIIFFASRGLFTKNSSWQAITATAFKCVKTSPRTLATKELIVAS
jgi:hypothetical protein